MPLSLGPDLLFFRLGKVDLLAINFSRMDFGVVVGDCCGLEDLRANGRDIPDDGSNRRIVTNRNNVVVDVVSFMVVSDGGDG